MNDLTISDFQKIIFANNITENIDNTTSIADIKTLSAAYPYVVFFTNISSENTLLNGEGNIWNGGRRLTKFVGLNPTTQYIEFGDNKIGLDFDSQTGLLGLVNANQIESITLKQIIYIDCNGEGQTINYDSESISPIYVDSKDNTFKLIFEFVLGEHANVDKINHTLNIVNQRYQKYVHPVIIVDGGTRIDHGEEQYKATFSYNCNIFYDTARRKGDGDYTNIDKFDFTSVYDTSVGGTIENLYLILNPNRKYLITQNGRLIITDVKETPVTLNPNWVYNDFYFSVTPVYDDEYPIYYNDRKLCFTLEPNQESEAVIVNDPDKGITPTYNIESGHVKFTIETKQPATEAELTTWVDIKVGKKITVEGTETIDVYDYLTKRLHIKINNSLFRYWYVGDEQLTNSSMPGEGTIYDEDDPISIGWHRLGPDTDSVEIGTIGNVGTERTWYIAAPSASKLEVLRSGDDPDDIYNTSLIEEFIIPYKLTLANGAKYNIFKVDLNRFQYTLTFNDGDYDPSNGRDFVNFNGVNWSTMNVGADSPTGIGEYFQWADTEGYNVEEIGGEGKQFTLNDYKYYTDPNYTKYNSTDEKIEIETNDDGSRNAFGGSWKIPTKQDFDNLIDCTTQVWVEDYNETGVSGILFTDTEDESKTLFFPTTGQASDGEIIATNYGTYWSRDILESDISDAYCLEFNYANDNINIQTNQEAPRSDGYVIRPVFYDAQP